MTSPSTGPTTGPTTGGPPQPQPEPAAAAGRALAWSLANTVVARVGTMAVGVVLARLLGPAEFGTYAVAFVALVALLSFNELGVSLAIVRWPDDPVAIAPTVTAVSVLTSLALTGAAWVAAPWFAEAMGDPGATGVVRLLSLCVLVNGVVATPAALLQRAFRQDQRMVADQVNVWVGAGVSVGLAVAGCGAWSLAYGRLAGSLLSAVLLVRYSPLPLRVGLDRDHLRGLLAFGLPLAGASVVVFVVGFVDQLVVGMVLGPVLLGYYVLAVNLAGWPVSMFSQPLRSVAPALFSRLRHDPDRMRGDLQRVLRPLAVVSVPLCGLLAVAAEPVVRFVYGAPWAPAAEALRWLAVLAAVRILTELAYDYLVVLGRSRALLALQCAWIVALVPAVWLGVRLDGIGGAALALAAVGVLVGLPLYLRELHRAGVEVTGLGRAVRPALLLTAAVASAAALVVGLGAGDLVTLAGCGTGAAVAVAAVLWRHRGDLDVVRGPRVPRTHRLSTAGRG
ncbi:lipopolysaccharide biosynthesis protein [Nocardioides sp. 1609]|uniref:lipopolysaccharide biosynthesis protein n=1 Tax=Nocardioides sp. 1609 TaxID=2508327 RepID=UPI001ADCF710|nr:lipopolysaccharide biosynthesis protein [Nocardioides sp. 1609]